MEAGSDAGNGMHIFSARERTDRGPRHRTETSFQFLDRVDQVYWSRVRGLLEDWICRYPAGRDRRDLIQRLRGTEDDAHYAAFWELYLHESLLRDGWTVTPHPALSGTSGQPDYLAVRRADTLLVEATTICRDTRMVAEHKRMQQVLAAVDAIPAQDFYLSVEYERIGLNSLSAKKLRGELEQWLSTLDAAAIRAALRATPEIGRWNTLPQIACEPGPGWRLVFTAWPVDEGRLRRPGTRTVGMEGPGEAVMVDDVGPLQRCLKGKVGKYGTMPQPFVIAVLDLSEYLPDDDACARALYGTLTGWFDVETHREHSPFRAHDGFWSSGRASAASVSAVLTTCELRPWTVPTAAPVLWQIPAPRVALPSLPWRSCALTTDEVSVVSSAVERDWRAFFGLPPEWPGPEAPFVR